MTEFITASCPICGSQIQVLNDSDSYFCALCGSELLLKKIGNVLIVNSVADDFSRMQKGDDIIAAELTRARITDQIKSLKAKKNKIIKNQANGNIPVLIYILLVIIGGLILFFFVNHQIIPGVLSSVFLVLPCLLAINLSKKENEAKLRIIKLDKKIIEAELMINKLKNNI